MKLLDILRKLGLIRENGIFYIGGSDVLPPPLKGAEELLTLQALEQGDEDARQRLVEHNLRLVVYIARRFENTGVNLEDLISIGTIGLIKAISTYRLDKKIKLATYASRCIENEILMYIRKTANQKTEVSLDEPINMDCDGNELLLSDILGTDEDMIMRPLEGAPRPARPGAGDRADALWPGGTAGADPEGGGAENGYFPVLHFPAGKADHDAAEKRISPSDKLRLIFRNRYGIIDKGIIDMISYRLQSRLLWKRRKFPNRF